MTSVLCIYGCSLSHLRDLLMSNFFKCSDLFYWGWIFIAPDAPSVLKGLGFVKSNLISKNISEEYTGLFCVLCYHHTIQQHIHIFPSTAFAPDTPVQVLTVQLFRSSLLPKLCQQTGPLGKLPEGARKDAAAPFFSKHMGSLDTFAMGDSNVIPLSKRNLNTASIQVNLVTTRLKHVLIGADPLNSKHKTIY